MGGLAWLPGAVRLTSRGGWMEGPKPVYAVVWHSAESDPMADPVSIARYVIQQGSEYHVVWNPWTGKTCQIMPATDSARSLKNDGTYRTNRVGSVRIQICVTGRAAHAPLVNSPRVGWDGIRDWLAGWGIPEVDVRDQSRSRSSWARSGHTDHRSAPGNDHWDPGRIDFDLLFRNKPPIEEDDMPLIVKQGTKSPVFISGSRSRVIDSKTEKAMKAAGVPVVKVDADDYQVFKEWSKPAQ